MKKQVIAAITIISILGAMPMPAMANGKLRTDSAAEFYENEIDTESEKNESATATENIETFTETDAVAEDETGTGINSAEEATISSESAAEESVDETEKTDNYSQDMNDASTVMETENGTDNTTGNEDKSISSESVAEESVDETEKTDNYSQDMNDASIVMETENGTDNTTGNGDEKEIPDAFLTTGNISVSDHFNAQTLGGEWKKTGELWYYYKQDGTYLKNCFLDDGENTYYIQSNGVMAVGWYQINNKWYYFRSWGAAYKNELFTDPDDGNVYYGDSTGAIVTSTWIQVGSKWYYFRSWGAAYRNELFTDPADGNVYYGDSTGAMVTSTWIQVGSKWYYFRSWGAAYRNELFTDPADGNVYYGDSTGAMVTSTWIQVGSKWYYFRSWGAAYRNELFTDPADGNVYYGLDDGSVFTGGWKVVGGIRRYFRNWGAMYKNESATIDGDRYVFNTDGSVKDCTLSVTRYQQEKSNWCWAAASQMAGRYRTSSTVTQSDIVRQLKGNTLPNVGGSLQDMVNGIKIASNNSKSATYGGAFSLSSVKNEIDSLQPFIIRMQWESGGGHAIVCAGYTGTGRVYCIDPWASTQNTTYSLSALLNGTSILTGNGYYSHTIYY